MKSLKLKNASPTILSCLAAIGIIGTVVLAVKATPKAMDMIVKAEFEKGRDPLEGMDDVVPLTPIETIQATWKCYIPTAAVGIGTILCIFGANGLNKRQQASLASAYALIDRAYKEYQSGAKKIGGESLDKEIRTVVAKENRTDISDISDDKVLFYDELSFRYFESTMIEVLDAEYHLNRAFVHEDSVKLNDFYDLLGLPKTEFGAVAGWDYDSAVAFYGYQWIDFEHDLVTMDDGLECYIIHIPFSPSVS